MLFCFYEPMDFIEEIRYAQDFINHDNVGRVRRNQGFQLIRVSRKPQQRT
jgi:hypothetical protein